MAFGAIHGGVRSKEWEAILVVLQLLRGSIPALHGVTLRAVGPKLPAMNVGVAIGAILTNIGENRLYVAESASHLFVHAAQWIFGFAVIELWDGADGPPAGSGVAVLAGNGERAMGIARGLILASGECASRMGSVGCRHASWEGERQQSPESELEQRDRINLPTPRRARLRKESSKNSIDCQPAGAFVTTVRKFRCRPVGPVNSGPKNGSVGWGCDLRRRFSATSCHGVKLKSEQKAAKIGGVAIAARKLRYS